MDPEPSPLVRVGRVFWAALTYVTVAVQRYLTPEPANTGNDDTLMGQEGTVTVVTEMQKWTEGNKHERENNEETEKKRREDSKNVADACDSGHRHAATWEQCLAPTTTETNRKTDQYVVKDIKVRVTEKVTERGEHLGNESTTPREKEAEDPQFTDEKKDRETESYGSISKHDAQTLEHISRGQREQENTNEDYHQDKSDLEPPQRDEKTKDKDSRISDRDGEEQTETKVRDRGRVELLENLVKTDEMRIIRVPEEENLREEMEEVVQIFLEDDKVDIEIKGPRNKEGTEKKGNCEDGEIAVGDEKMKTMERERQGSIQGAHIIKEKPKEETELATRLTVFEQGELRKKDVGSDRDFLKPAGKDKERYDEKYLTQQLFSEEQYGEVSGTEEGKNDDEEELASAVEGSGTEIADLEREEDMHACDVKGEDKRNDVKSERETHKPMSRQHTEERICIRDVEERDKGREKEGTDAEAGGTDRVKYESNEQTSSSSEETFLNIRGDGESVKDQDGDLTKRTKLENASSDLGDEKTTTAFDGMERERSLQRTDGDIEDKSECKMGKLETNCGEMGTILIEGMETGDERNKITVQEGRVGQTDATVGDGESKKFGSETEVETEVKSENNAGGWRVELTKEQKMQESQGGQNGNGAVRGQIGASNMNEDKAITDLEEKKLCQTEVTEDTEENESKGYSEKGEMEGIEMRNTETENTELKEIAEECGVVAGEAESSNLLGKRQEIQNKTTREEKQEHERHVFKESEEAPLVSQGDIGYNSDLAVEMETGAMDDEGDDEGGKDGEEESMILKEEIGGENSKEVGESEYGGEMETSVCGTEEEGDKTEVRPELMVPIPVGRNDDVGLKEITNSDEERDHFTKDTQTGEDASEKDARILSTGEDEIISDNETNKNNLREMIMENKVEEPRGSEACSEIKDMESVEMRKTETEEKDINKSRGETEKEESVAETEKIETIWPEAEVRGEMEEDTGIKAPAEEACHKGAVERLALEEGDERIKDEWKDDIPREIGVRRMSGEQVNIMCYSDRQEINDNEGLSMVGQVQSSELTTERKQENKGKEFDPAVDIEGGSMDDSEEEEEAEEEEEEGEEEEGDGIISKERAGGMNSKEVVESEYGGEMETSVCGTEKEADRMEVRLMVPVPVEENDDVVLNEETHVDVERDNFTKDTQAGEDADEKDTGIFSTGEDERITDNEMNKNNLREMIMENKVEEPRGSEACSEIKDMESVEMRKTETEDKDVNKSRGETEKEESVAETEKIETIWPEAEVRGEMEEDTGIKAPAEDAHRKGAVDQLALEEGDERVKEEWKEDIPREIRVRSMSGEHVNIMCYSDRQAINDNEGMNMVEQVQSSELATEREQENKGKDLDRAVNTEGGSMDDAEEEEEEEEEEEDIISKERKEAENSKEVGESEYGTEMETSVCGTEEEEDESEVKPEFLPVPVPVGRNDDVVLKEIAHSDEERDHFTKDTQTGEDADEKDARILSTGEDERITDNETNKNNLREMIMENEVEEPRGSEACSEIKDMESVEMRKTETEDKDVNKSRGEVEKEESVAETEKIETIWPEAEIRGEMEENTGITAEDAAEEANQKVEKPAVEKPALEEGDELIREEWKEDVQREKTEGSSNCMEVKVILDGDRQERKDDEGSVWEQGHFSVSGAEDKEEDAEEEEEECMILKDETEGKNTQEAGESECAGEMEANVCGTEKKGDEIEGRAEYLQRNTEEVKPTEIQGEEFDDGVTEEKTSTSLDHKQTDGQNLEENDETKETIDEWIELHTPSLDFTAQKSRIALKNALSRPPRNPRSLLNTPSLLPTPSESQQSRKPTCLPGEVKQGGPIITGVKLPGIGGGFPVLKRTDRGLWERNVTAESSSPDDTKTPSSETEEVVGGKTVGIGVIGVKLPGITGGFPALRKTERGMQMREQTPEENRTGTSSTEGITAPAVKQIGFPVLRKTERGVRIREEDAQCSTQNSEVEKNITGVDHQESVPKAKAKWTPPRKPGIGMGNPSMISELKNKLRKTE